MDIRESVWGLTGYRLVNEGSLLLFAAISIWLPGFATGRVVLGAVVALVSLSEIVNAKATIVRGIAASTALRHR